MSENILNIVYDTAEQFGIKHDKMCDIVKAAITTAVHREYGKSNNIAIDIKHNGDIVISRKLTIIPNTVGVDNFVQENDCLLSANQTIPLAKARLIRPDVNIGEEITEDLSWVGLLSVSRGVAREAYDTIKKCVREAVLERQYQQYKNFLYQIVMGTVTRIEHGNVIINIGNAEACLPMNNLIPGEVFRKKDHVKACISNVRQSNTGYQVFLSRIHKELISELFKQEIPEIQDNVIIIKAVARDPGSRAKVAVHCLDKNIDPIGACIGIKGIRIQAIMQELRGEKIDIVLYSANLANFVINTVKTHEVIRVTIDEESHSIELVVPDNQLSMVIGKRGQNIRLISELIGWKINVKSEKEDTEQRMLDFNNATTLLMQALNLEEIIGQVLVTEGFTSIESIANAAVSNLSSIDVFEDTIAAELIKRAQEYLENKQTALMKKVHELGIKTKLLNFNGLTIEQVVKLGEDKIKSIADLADLSKYELQEILPDLSDSIADTVIIKARQQVWNA